MTSGTSTFGGRGPLLARGQAAHPAATAAPPTVRIVAFGVLALYGTLRWGTLMTGAPTGRLLALVVVAIALAALGPWLGARSTVLAVLAAAVAAVAMLALAGLPVSWIRHVRIAVAARHIESGLSALPRLLVPYRGANEWVRTVMVLGAAVLLFDAAVMMAFAMRAPEARGVSEPSRTGDLRRAVAALPLIALATVPLTLVPAQFQYLQGAIMFTLLAALVWGERLHRHGSGTATLVCGLAVAVAMVLAPAIDAHKPWIQYQTLSGGLALGYGESFDWSQGYGPLNWPRSGRDVLEVQASPAERAYWKAVDLNVVTPSGWIAGPTVVSDGSPLPNARDRTLGRFTQTVKVTVEELKTSDVLGPGELDRPTDYTQVPYAGNSPGRWLTVQPMGFGDSYSVTGYAPDPSAAELRRAGTNYPSSVVPGYVEVDLPALGQPPGSAFAWVDPFGQPAPILVHGNGGPGDATPLLTGSGAYARAYTLASRLRAHAASAYDYVQSVLAYLHERKFQYDENPPASRYPLDSFLFTSYHGYCQQFAGAMALLLRLGGVPARVAAGFTTGTYDTTLHRWVVTDFDAHAWVEAYFPRYGWVSFEPTPASGDPAQQHIRPLGAPIGGSSTGLTTASKTNPGGPGHGTRGDLRSSAAGSHRSGASLELLVPGGLAALAVLVLLGLLVRHMLLAGDPELLLAELERAFVRTGRPLVPQCTLAQLEHRMDGVPEAQAYVRTLARARFAGGGELLPSRGQRRALRGYLRAGLGISGAVRAFWALPPLFSQLKLPIKRVTGQ